jgi:hypothetical protein
MIHGHVAIAARGWTSVCARIRTGGFARGPAGRDTGGMRELQVVDAAGLALAYAAAEYAVALDGDALPLRVGRPARDLEAYWPARRYVLVSAWNPASQPHSDSANQAADERLVARLDAAGVQRHAAWAQDQAGQWREPGWLLADLDDAAADALAREFGQAGVLAWQRGEPVRLRMLIARPDEAAASEHTDWAGD